MSLLEVRPIALNFECKGISSVIDSTNGYPQDIAFDCAHIASDCNAYALIEAGVEYIDVVGAVTFDKFKHVDGVVSKRVFHIKKIAHPTAAVRQFDKKSLTLHHETIKNSHLCIGQRLEC